MVLVLARSKHPSRPLLGGTNSDDVLREIREELRSLRAPSKPDKTLASLASEWLPRKLRRVKAGRSLESRVRLHLVPGLGQHTCSTLRKAEVQDFLDGLVAKGYSAQTANHVREAGRQLVEDAIENGGWVGPNPFHLVPKMKLPEPDSDVLTRHEAARLLRWVTPFYRPLFALELFLGPRKSTAINIRTDDLHLRDETIDFRVTKTGKPIMGIPIPAELLPYLETQLKRARGPWLFTRRDGAQHCAGSHVLNDELERALERAEIRRGSELPKLTFHGLRRVSSCLHQESGCHPWVVSKVLGHSQASLLLMGNVPENMTAKRYTRFSEEFVRQELNRLTLKLRVERGK